MERGGDGLSELDVFVERAMSNSMAHFCHACPSLGSPLCMSKGNFFGAFGGIDAMLFWQN
jgi:hypothetical protein